MNRRESIALMAGTIVAPLLVRYSPATAVEVQNTIGIAAESKAGLIEFMKGYPAMVTAGGDFPDFTDLLFIRQPCGETYHYRTAADIPEVSVQCRCGKAGCWPLKYSSNDIGESR